jgi:hypothetical protein
VGMKGSALQEIAWATLPPFLLDLKMSRSLVQADQTHSHFPRWRSWIIGTSYGNSGPVKASSQGTWKHLDH